MRSVDTNLVKSVKSVYSFYIPKFVPSPLVFLAGIFFRGMMFYSYVGDISKMLMKQADMVNNGTLEASKTVSSISVLSFVIFLCSTITRAAMIVYPVLLLNPPLLIAFCVMLVLEKLIRVIDAVRIIGVINPEEYRRCILFNMVGIVLYAALLSTGVFGNVLHSSVFAAMLDYSWAGSGNAATDEAGFSIEKLIGKTCCKECGRPLGFSPTVPVINKVVTIV